MNETCSRRMTFGALASLVVSGVVLACGTPPPMLPPPPPPDPPVVCCNVIWRGPCPIDPCNFEYWIACYGRIDGVPLFNSNPMPLLPSQRCLCAVPPLPPAAVACGASVVGFWFTNPLNLPWDPRDIQDEKGYGPFEPVKDDSTQFQVDQFFDIYYQAAGIPLPLPASDAPGRTQRVIAGDSTAAGAEETVSAGTEDGLPGGPTGGFASIFGFRGPGQIIPGVVFNCYVCYRVPRGFDPNKLCLPLEQGAIMLFLQDGQQVLLEPDGPGQPPIPLPAWQPGRGAVYKFNWYPVAVPPSCPFTLQADVNDDNKVDSADLSVLIGQFGQVGCGCCFLGDADGDGDVDLDDLVIVNSNQGLACPPGAVGCDACPGDVDSNGVVDANDLAIVTANQGLTCP